MLVEVDRATFEKLFPNDPHPFVSGPFSELNRAKAEEIVRLVDSAQESTVGLLAGLREGALLSPFSAPFGGFHFRKENVYISEIDRFVKQLKDYAISRSLTRIEIVTPPDIYHGSFNAKAINSLIRNGYSTLSPDITNWVDLKGFNGAYNQKNSREYFRQAQRNKLEFSLVLDSNEWEAIYNLIRINRAKFGRPIFMTLDNIISTGKLWPVDFFKVETSENSIVAGAIFYRNHPDICFAVFWGDNDEGRSLRAMDYLLLNLFTYYKTAGYRYMDLGISTESGVPNEGLLRFKESHESVSSLRYRFILDI
jgi:hypothetical protein